MLLRTTSLYFCCGCWFVLLIGVLPTEPQSSFQLFTGTKITSGPSGYVKTGKTLFECFMQCVLDPLCSGLTVENYTAINGGFYHVVECDHLYLEGHRELTLSVDSQVTTVVKFSFFQDSFKTRKFSNVRSSNITATEVISIPNGQREEYCFLHCALMGSNCQGLQIEKSCHTNETSHCHFIDIPLSSTPMSLQPDCSSDIYLKETGT